MNFMLKLDRNYEIFIISSEVFEKSNERHEKSTLIQHLTKDTITNLMSFDNIETFTWKVEAMKVIFIKQLYFAGENFRIFHINLESVSMFMKILRVVTSQCVVYRLENILTKASARYSLQIAFALALDKLNNEESCCKVNTIIDLAMSCKLAMFFNLEGNVFKELSNKVKATAITITETATESSATLGIESAAQAVGQAAAGVVVTVAIDVALTSHSVYKAKKQRDKGFITRKQFQTKVKKKVCESGFQFIGGTTGSVVGQLLIPVPGLGAFVGGLCGSLIGTGIGKGISYGLFERNMELSNDANENCKNYELIVKVLEKIKSRNPEHILIYNENQNAIRKVPVSNISNRKSTLHSSEAGSRSPSPIMGLFNKKKKTKKTEESQGVAKETQKLRGKLLSRDKKLQMVSGAKSTCEDTDNNIFDKRSRCQKQQIKPEEYNKRVRTSVRSNLKFWKRKSYSQIDISDESHEGQINSQTFATNPAKHNKSVGTLSEQVQDKRSESGIERLQENQMAVNNSLANKDFLAEGDFGDEDSLPDELNNFEEPDKEEATNLASRITRRINESWKMPSFSDYKPIFSPRKEEEETKVSGSQNSGEDTSFLQRFISMLDDVGSEKENSPNSDANCSSTQENYPTEQEKTNIASQKEAFNNLNIADDVTNDAGSTDEAVLASATKNDSDSSQNATGNLSDSAKNLLRFWRNKTAEKFADKAVPFTDAEKGVKKTVENEAKVELEAKESTETNIMKKFQGLWREKVFMGRDEDVVKQCDETADKNEDKNSYLNNKVKEMVSLFKLRGNGGKEMKGEGVYVGSSEDSCSDTRAMNSASPGNNSRRQPDGNQESATFKKQADMPNYDKNPNIDDEDGFYYSGPVRQRNAGEFLEHGDSCKRIVKMTEDEVNNDEDIEDESEEEEGEDTKIPFNQHILRLLNKLKSTNESQSKYESEDLSSLTYDKKQWPNRDETTGDETMKGSKPSGHNNSLDDVKTLESSNIQMLARGNVEDQCKTMGLQATRGGKEEQVTDAAMYGLSTKPMTTNGDEESSTDIPQEQSENLFDVFLRNLDRMKETLQK
eukprot:gene10168-11207_t